MLKIVQLSDTHLDGDPAVRARLTRVVGHIKSLAETPDALLITGDIIEGDPRDGADAEFAWLDAELSLGLPVLYVPGNSDETGAYRRFLTARGDAFDVAGDQVHRSVEVGEVTFLLIDATVPGAYYGRLHRESLTWIRERLSSLDARPAILVMHQPPAVLGHPVVDTLRLLDSDELEAIAAASPAVIAVICGHTHGSVATTFGGKPLVVGPGVHSYGQMPLEHGTPGAGLIKEDFPPAYATHLIDGRRMITYFEVCPS
jgi:3',5'-cyclic-AMP phosphodiesterase